MPEVISFGLVAELCRHLNQFVQARLECMKLYPFLVYRHLANVLSVLERQFVTGEKSTYRLSGGRRAEKIDKELIGSCTD